MDISVATRDATPAITVAAASNFCPVPPLILFGGRRASKLPNLDLIKKRSLGCAKCVVWEMGLQGGMDDDDSNTPRTRSSKHRGCGMDRGSSH
jgi:hypothetical protein